MSVLSDALKGSNVSALIVHAEIAPGSLIPTGAPMVVRVLDTSYQDAEAEVITTTKVVVQEDRIVKVPLFFPTPNENLRITVDAWVDVDGDGRVSVGDFLTMISYPYKGQDSITVELKPVRG